MIQSNIDNTIIFHLSSNIKKGDKVLDIGCGNIQLMMSLSEIFKDIEYTGLDIDPSVISLMEKAIAEKKISNNFHTILGSYHYGLRADYSVCISSRLCHHLNHSEAVKLIQKMIYAVRRNGRLLIIDSIRDFNGRNDRFYYTPFFFINEVCNQNPAKIKFIYNMMDELLIGTYWLLVADVTEEENCFNLQIIK